LLWAAYGINRPDNRRTAPTARNQQELEIYCAMENGLFLWNAERNVLIPIIKEDIREKTGKQEFVKTAPLNLIFVCNNNKFEGGINEMQRGWTHVDAGYISENIYLFCTSFGMSTVVRGLFDRDELAKIMQLPESSWIVITQSVGYPK
jgi:nitroreductase